MRWYKPGGVSVQYEEYFYCEDLGTQLKLIIENYSKVMSSSSSSDSSSSSTAQLSDAAVVSMKNELTNLSKQHQIRLPRDLNPQIQHFLCSKEHALLLIDSEFRMAAIKATRRGALNEEVGFVRDRSKRSEKARGGEIFLWQRSGSTTLLIDSQVRSLSQGEVLVADWAELKEIDQREGIADGIDEDNCLIVISNRNI